MFKLMDSYRTPLCLHFWRDYVLTGICVWRIRASILTNRIATKFVKSIRQMHVFIHNNRLAALNFFIRQLFLFFGLFSVLFRMHNPCHPLAVFVSLSKGFTHYL